MKFKIALLSTMLLGFSDNLFAASSFSPHDIPLIEFLPPNQSSTPSVPHETSAMKRIRNARVAWVQQQASPVDPQQTSLHDEPGCNFPEFFTSSMRQSFVTPIMLKRTFLQQPSKDLNFENMPLDTAITGHQSEHLYLVASKRFPELSPASILVFISHRQQTQQLCTFTCFRNSDVARKWVFEQLRKAIDPPCCC